VPAGGPDVLTHEAIARLAFDALQRPARVSHLPDAVRRGALAATRWLPGQWTGPAEFFLARMGLDLVAPALGQRTLAEHFRAGAAG